MPNPSNGNNVRNVNTSGALNNNNANNNNGVAADCILNIYGSERVRKLKAVPFYARKDSPFRLRSMKLGNDAECLDKDKLLYTFP